MFKKVIKKINKMISTKYYKFDFRSFIQKCINFNLFYECTIIIYKEIMF